MATIQSVKIYWNGIKINDEKMIRCAFGRKAENGNIIIYGKHYDDLPRELFDVTNDSDLYTDLFKNDKAIVKPAHPLYKYVLSAWYGYRYHEDKRSLKYHDKDMAFWTGRADGADIVKRHKEEKAAALERMAIFEKMPKPGQPTAADVEKIDQQRQEEKNRREQEAHEKKLRLFENRRNYEITARHLIADEKNKNPLSTDAPFVVIRWSEHPALYDGDVFSIAAADRVLRKIEELRQTYREQAPDEWGGYEKTAFEIRDAEDNTLYIGRYDIGDNDGGLISHVKQFLEYCATMNEERAEEAAELLQLLTA